MLLVSPHLYLNHIPHGTFCRHTPPYNSHLAISSSHPTRHTLLDRSPSYLFSLPSSPSLSFSRHGSCHAVRLYPILWYLYPDCRWLGSGSRLPPLRSLQLQASSCPRGCQPSDMADRSMACKPLLSSPTWYLTSSARLGTPWLGSRRSSSTSTSTPASDQLQPPQAHSQPRRCDLLGHETVR